MIVAQGFLILLAIAVSFPIMIFVSQVLASIFYSSSTRRSFKKGKRPSIAILVPAHNEADVIASTLAELHAQLSAGDRILVVADNCSDHTADVCRNQGIEVLERFDDNKRGKGYALEFGFRHLNKRPKDVLIIIDADCELGAGCLDILAHDTDTFKRPVQALYLMETENVLSVKQKFAQFAWIVKNKVRPMGFSVLGLPCQLMGSGMAFPWKTMRIEDIGNDSIVEDLEMGLNLASRDLAPKFSSDAVVLSHFPKQDDIAEVQRTRWEHGHLRVMFEKAPAVLLSSLRQRNLDLFAMGLDLLVPPLSLLVMVDIAVSGLTLVLHIVGISTAFIILLVVNAFFVSAIWMCWKKYANDILNWRDFFSILVYLLWKVPIYLRFIIKPETTWIKTKRN